MSTSGPRTWQSWPGLSCGPGDPASPLFREETKMENLFARRPFGARLARGSQTSSPAGVPEFCQRTHKRRAHDSSAQHSDSVFESPLVVILGTHWHGNAYSSPRFPTASVLDGPVELFDAVPSEWFSLPSSRVSRASLDVGTLRCRWAPRCCSIEVTTSLV